MRRVVHCATFRLAAATATVAGASRWQGFGGKAATGLPMDETEGWQIPKMHKNFNTINLGTSYKTACGRIFDPDIYGELMQAMSDQSWAQAIGRKLGEDKEYIYMLRTKGGAAQKVDQIVKRGVSNDEEFMRKLKVLLEADAEAALGVCAIQDAYAAIRKKRDEHSTDAIAEGQSPLSIAQKGREFGQPLPGSKGPGRM